LDAAVAELFLDVEDVLARLQQQGRERVPKVNGVSDGFPRDRAEMTVPNADRAIIAADKLTA
jgi:hypothetical protein